MSTSVNVPTDPTQRDQDVDHKLRLYGIYNAFANGKLPSNAQIDVALTSFINHNKLRNPNPELSPEGKVILEDFRNVVEQAKWLLLTKNYDQALQEFIWNATQLGRRGVPMDVPDAPVDQGAASNDASEGMAGLETLGRLIISNGQFRKLLRDAITLLRSIAGDTATKAASRLNPTEEHLRQIDDPAPDHEWHETPNLSRENVKQQFRDRIDRNKPVGRSDLREVTANATQTADLAGSQGPQDQHQGTQSGVDVVTGIRAGIDDLQRRVDENIPEEHKQRGQEYRDRTKNYLQSQMPKERRERTIWRLKKMVVEIQSHQDYSEAINTLLNLATTYTGYGRDYVIKGAENAKGVRQDTHLRAAQRSLKALIERFADNTSIDDLMDAVNDIYRDADKDPELKNWFRSVNQYIRNCLQQEGYIIEPQSTNEYHQLYDQGNFLLRNRYRDHTDRLMDEFTFIGDQLASDPENNKFADSLQKLFNDLGNDEHGKSVFREQLIKDITGVVIPDVLESIRYVPIPRIEYSDPVFDAVVENLVLEGDNLMPNMLEIGNDSNFRFGRKAIASKRSQSVIISVSQIQCDLRDISYYIKRKKGFPSITDTGVADIFLGGDGFGFNLHLSNAQKTDRAQFFKVDSVNITMKHLRIKLKQSTHKTLFSIFKPLLLKVLKPVIIKTLEQQIRQIFSRLDAFCFRIHQEQRQIEAAIRENPDPENVQNIYSRYYQAFQKEVRLRRKRAQDKVADKHANMAVTTEDSMFKHIQLPGGISTRAAEYKKQAGTGDRWENDIFSIGSASPTAGLPAPATVSRKSPHANRRRVKGKDSGSVGGYSRDSGYQGHIEGVPVAEGDERGDGHSAGKGAGGYSNGNPVVLNREQEEPYARYATANPYT